MIVQPGQGEMIQGSLMKLLCNETLVSVDAWIELGIELGKYVSSNERIACFFIWGREARMSGGIVHLTAG